MKVKGTVRAWAAYHPFSEIEQNILDNDFERALSNIRYTNLDMSPDAGWTEIGVATITVEFFPREAIVSKQVEGLREQLRQHRIKAEQAEQAILSQIQNLMAISA